jgi:hypothetical protein
VETIVQQIIAELGRNICKRIEEGGISNIDQFASDALGLCKESVRALISGIVKQLNEELRADKAFRKEQGLVLKEKDRQRSLLTEGRSNRHRTRLLLRKRCLCISVGFHNWYIRL